VRNISIKQKRLDARLTQAELARLIGVGQSAVAQWEAGTNNPRLVVLKRMAEVLKCSIDDLAEPDKAEGDA
jgi:transcriptional regulator with XRE-family HTH domain